MVDRTGKNFSTSFPSRASSSRWRSSVEEVPPGSGVGTCDFKPVFAGGKSPGASALVGTVTGVPKGSSRTTPGDAALVGCWAKSRPGSAWIAKAAKPASNSAWALDARRLTAVAAAALAQRTSPMYSPRDIELCARMSRIASNEMSPRSWAIRTGLR